MLRNQQPSKHHVEVILSRVIDCGLASIIFVAPLFMGGRHPVGRLVYVALVCFTAIAWCVRQSVKKAPKWRASGVEWLLLAGVVIVVLQLVPLAPSTLDSLSPHLFELLPLWSSDSTSSGTLGTWNQISLTPYATRSALVMYLSHALLFLVVMQRIRDVEDVERLLRWVAIAAIGMSIIGLVQFCFGNGKFLWFYDYPHRNTFRVVKGTFANENHTAHFLALGVAPLIWWMQRLFHTPMSETSRRQFCGRTTRRRPHHSSQASLEVENLSRLAIPFGLGIVALAGLLTLSRGGVLVIFLAALFCAGLYVWRSLLSPKVIAVLLLSGVFAAGALAIHGQQELSKQMATLGTGSIDDIDGNAVRRKLWQANLAAVAKFPIFGTGGGSHSEVYPTFYTHYSQVEFTHAENGYLQTCLEYGLVGLALLITGLAICCYWSVKAFRKSKSQRTIACTIAVLSGLFVSIVHSAWDFVWYVPACMSIATVLVACICRLSQFHDSVANKNRKQKNATTLNHGQQNALRQFVWLTATAATIGLSVFIIKNELAPAIASHDHDGYMKIALAVSVDDDPADVEQSVQQMMPKLDRYLRTNPCDARANLKMAALCMRRFEMEQASAPNSMPLAQIRNTVIAAGFPTINAQNKWLTVAVGDNLKYLKKASAHLRRAAWLCPLQGEAYVYLSHLSFLERAPQEVNEAYFEQALITRPHSGTVQLAAGVAAAESHNLSAAISHWKRAFHHDPQYQQEIIKRLAPLAPASVLLTQFEPDVDAMGRLYRQYHRINRLDEAKVIGRQFALALEEVATCEDSQRAAMRLRAARNVNAFLGNQHAALRCIKRAVELTPSDIQLRRALISSLIDNKQYDQAIAQVKWCLQRHPDDEFLHNRLVHARKQQRNSVRDEHRHLLLRDNVDHPAINKQDTLSSVFSD